MRRVEDGPTRGKGGRVARHADLDGPRDADLGRADPSGLEDLRIGRQARGDDAAPNRDAVGTARGPERLWPL